MAKKKVNRPFILHKWNWKPEYVEKPVYSGESDTVPNIMYSPREIRDRYRRQQPVPQLMKDPVWFDENVAPKDFPEARTMDRIERIDYARALRKNIVTYKARAARTEKQIKEVEAEIGRRKDIEAAVAAAKAEGGE